ncbi:hypothetical protein ABE42_35920 [Bacillus thuringiensis]|nr:hypothetical protein [Bacillus thuringiensis]
MTIPIGIPIILWDISFLCTRTKFIVFPNPMYGDWEAALYQYDFKKSDTEKDKLRKDALHVFEDAK